MSTEAANEICYHKPNSFRGLEMVKSLGMNAGDFDVNVTKDRKIVVTHWPQPYLAWVGFIDKSGHFKRGSRVALRDITYAQLKDTESRLNGYKIWDMEHFMDRAAKLGICPFFEWKGGRGTDDLFKAQYSIVRNSGGIAKFMTLPTASHMEAMYHAGKAGFETGVLARGTITKPWFDDAKITFWKGSAAAGKYRGDSGAVHLATSAGRATRYGTGNIGSELGAKRAKARIEAQGGHVDFYKAA
jgi:hypothetical protein